MPQPRPIVLVTGATAGIGRAIAQRFITEGYRVIATGRRRDRLEALQNDLGGAEYVYPASFDIRDASAVETFWEALPEQWQPVEVLVNNAGLARGLDFFWEGKLSDWEEMIDTNLKGLLYISKVVAAHMIQQGGGFILNIGSTAAKESYPKGNVYAATKRAVESLTEGMRHDLMGTGVRAAALHPGLVNTEFGKVRFHGDEQKAAAAYRGMRPLTGEDVAEVAWYMASQPRHMTLSEVTLVPTAQVSSKTVHREEAEEE